jgi:hypothetical protein
MTGPGPGFGTGDRVWVAGLNQVGVVQQVGRGYHGEIEYYVLRVAEGAGLLSIVVSPSAVAKWLQP